MKMTRLAGALVLAAAHLAQVAQAAPAMTFTQAYEAAVAYDATYRSAGRELEAAQFNVPIARASLLPLVTFSASDANVQGLRKFPNGQNQDVRVRLDYDAPQASLQMRVPILNLEALGGYKQAKAQTEVAEEVFRSQGMDLMDRLASAYLQLILSDESVRLFEAQTAAFESQLAQFQQRQQRGEATRVQVVQSQASLDVSRARLLDAQDQLELSRRQLARVTGVQGTVLGGLPTDQRTAPLFPNRLGDWMDIAIRQSPMLKARERNLDVARLAVRKQQAGHMPRVDLVGSLSQSESDSTNTIGQSSRLRTVGVQLTVPLFNGGGIDASVKQALARQAQADEEIRGEREAVEVDIQRHFQALVIGAEKISAYEKAVASTALAWQGARRSLELGLATLADVADAQTQHFVSKRDLAQARIDLLLSRVRLMLRAGVPMPDVAADLDSSLMAVTPSLPTSSKP